MGEKRTMDGNVYSITNNLRIELETKIEKMLPLTWFWASVSALVAIAALFWCFSYSRLLDWKEKTTEKIHQIDIKTEVNKEKFGLYREMNTEILNKK